MNLDDAVVWREAQAMPSVIDDTVHGLSGMGERLRSALAGAGIRRVVLTGNGASLHAAMSAWHAARSGPTELHVEWVPAGHLGSGVVPLGASDALIAFSASGELRDVVDALARHRPGLVVALTTQSESRIGVAADLVLPVLVCSQDAVTHTQAYASITAAGLWLAATLRTDTGAYAALEGAAAVCREGLAVAPDWAMDILTGLPQVSSSVCVGGGTSWPAALQAALMLREIGALPSEPAETREAVTSLRCALGPGQFVLALPNPDDSYFEQALASMRGTGAHVVVAPDPHGHPHLAPLSLFAAPLALSILMAQRLGLDPDNPPWYADYLAVARVASRRGRA